MKSFSRGNLKVASASLRSNKARSFLTMLGIIIAVSSVITIVSIGQGVKQQVHTQISRTGKDLIAVRPGQVDTASLGGFKLLSSVQTNSALSQRDLDIIQKTPGVGAAVPLGVVGGAVRAERGSYGDGPVVAAGDKLASLLNQGMAYGAFFSGDENTANVAILGAHAADAMFNDMVPLGQTFSFRGQQFMVRGVLNDFASTPLSGDIDFNNAIFIPYADSQQLTNNNIAPYEILARPLRPAQADTVIAAVHANLLNLHGDSHDFSVVKQGDNLATAGSVIKLLTELVAGVAAVSLFVGGIGIMNIMLVSVTERMHEIGIRKAVGATSRQILYEFMSEAFVLSVVGVLVGILVAGIVVLVLRIGTDLTPIIQWQIVLLAAAVSIAIGVLFGSAPALKAARKDPIAALRNE